MATKKMTDKERLSVVLRAIGQRSCPGGSFDKCRAPSGCFDGGYTCSFHLLLDPERLASRERFEERAEARNLKFLRAENKALRARLDEIKAAIDAPVVVSSEDAP